MSLRLSSYSFLIHSSVASSGTGGFWSSFGFSQKSNVKGNCLKLFYLQYFKNNPLIYSNLDLIFNSLVHEIFLVIVCTTDKGATESYSRFQAIHHQKQGKNIHFIQIIVFTFNIICNGN